MTERGGGATGDGMKMLLLLGVIGLCAYLYFTQTAQSAKEAAAKEQAMAEAAEKAAVAAARQSAASATPVPASNKISSAPTTNGSTPAPKPGDWMWQKSTLDPKQRKQ